MRTLKTVVITLGVLLVVGFGVLVFGLTQNWQRLASPAQTAPAAPAALANWGRVALGQAADAHIQSITAAGRVIVVHVASGNTETLLVLDPATGAVIGAFALTGQP